MKATRAMAGRWLVAALLASCGTMEPFSRGPDLTPDAGAADAGHPPDTDGGGTPSDGGEETVDAGPPAPHFRADVHPLLFDCTACHADGASAFKLTGDDAADWEAAVARVDLETPEASLLVTKPTKAVDHQGGQLWQADGTQATTVLAWIRAGAKDD